MEEILDFENCKYLLILVRQGSVNYRLKSIHVLEPSGIFSQTKLRCLVFCFFLIAGIFRAGFILQMYFKRLGNEFLYCIQLVASFLSAS